MSDETQLALNEAEKALSAAEARADECKRQCLDTVADGIPAAVDAEAKKIAKSQPDVTRQLGPEGVKELRDDLAAAAANLADYLRDGADKIDWPAFAGGFASKIAQRDIHNALSNYMYGQPIDQVGKVFGRHGYDLKGVTGRTAQGLLRPRSLYEETAFEAVAAALNEVGAAREAFNKAKAADDQDAVEDLWS